MKKQLILIFVSFLLMTTLFMSNNIKAAPGDVSIADFDAPALNGQFNSVVAGDEVTLKRMSGTTNLITNVWASSGTQSYYSGSINTVTHQTGWINLTEDYSYISNIAFTTRDQWDTDGSSSYPEIVMKFYNDSILVLYIKFDANDDCLYYGADSAWHEISSGDKYIDDANWYTCYWNISHTTGNQLIFNVTGSWTADDVVGTSSVVSEWTTFDSIKIETYNGAVSAGRWEYFYFDSLIINTGTGGGIGGGGDDEFPGLLLETPNCMAMGSIPMMRYMNWFGQITDSKYDSVAPLTNTQPCKYIEMQYNKAVNTTIYWVDIYVDTDQYLSISSSGSDYSCRVNNNPFVFSSWTPKSMGITSGYLIRFGGSAIIENEKPLICFGSNEYFDSINYGSPIYWYPMIMNDECNWDTRKHNITADYTDNQLDGVKFNNGAWELDGHFYFVNGHVSPYVQYWYSGGETEYEGSEELPTTPEMDNYTTKYGDSFIEFYENDINCRYGIGCSPKIIYHLNNSQCNLYNKYRWEIVDTTTEDIIMTGFIGFTVNDDEKFVIYTHWDTFKYIGQFYISLWNLTTNMQNDEVVMTSQNNIIVCTDSGCQNDVTDIDDSGIPSIDEMIASIPIYFKVILALFTIIIITICPYFFAVLIGRGTNNHIELPSLVYIAFFFVGLVVSIALGFLEAWVFFVIFFGLILTFVILWIRGQSTGGE